MSIHTIKITGAFALLALLLTACGPVPRQAVKALVREGARTALAESAASAGGSFASRTTDASAAREVEGTEGAPATAPEHGTGARAAGSVGSFAVDIAASDQAAATITSCSAEALDATADEYAAAFNAGNTAPALDPVFTQTLLGCLTAIYPEQEQAAADVTAIVRDTVAAATAQAVGAGLTPQEFYDWMKFTAASMRGAEGAVS